MDARKYKVTLQLPDGSTRKVKVGKKVNLAAVVIGTDVTVQGSEALAISVKKPQSRLDFQALNRPLFRSVTSRVVRLWSGPHLN